MFGRTAAQGRDRKNVCATRMSHTKLFCVGSLRTGRALFEEATQPVRSDALTIKHLFTSRGVYEQEAQRL